MVFGEWIIGVIVGIVIGIVIRAKITTHCKHNWKLMDSGNITNYNYRGEKIVRGWIKVYECSHCKKMKTNKTTLDD